MLAIVVIIVELNSFSASYLTFFKFVLGETPEIQVCAVGHSFKRINLLHSVPTNKYKKTR